MDVFPSSHEAKHLLCWVPQKLSPFPHLRMEINPVSEKLFCSYLESQMMDEVLKPSDSECYHNHVPLDSATEFSPHTLPVSLTSILILFPHLYLGRPNWLFPSGFPTTFYMNFSFLRFVLRVSPIILGDVITSTTV
jgi:hypothetical protein